MSLLDETFLELLAKLRDSNYLNPAKSDPIFYFVYPPELMLELKSCFTRWTARLRDAGWNVRRVSFCDLLWECVEETGRWESWLEVEPDFDRDQIIKAVAEVLDGEDRLIGKVMEIVRSAVQGEVLFFTETEVLHPYFRTRAIENRIHDRVQVPVVIFYPGKRTGQYGLKFLGFHTEDSNYRSVIIGGI